MTHYENTNIYYKTAIANYFRGVKDKEDIVPLASEQLNQSHFYKLPAPAYEQLKEHNLFRRVGTVYQRLDSTISLHMVKSPQASVEAIQVGDNYPAKEVRETIQTVDAHKLATILLVNRDTVLDKSFDINTYISAELAKQFGQKEEQLCLLGTGQKEPFGLLNKAEVGSTASSLTLEALEKLYLSLDATYRHHGTWIMSDETKLQLHKIVDKNNQPILPYGATELFGCPIETSPFMPNTGKAITFGDMSHYWFVERQILGVRSLQEPYLVESKVGFQGMERFDAHLTHTDAVKVLDLQA